MVIKYCKRNRKKIGYYIKTQRRKQKITQEFMSDLTGIKQEYISMIENGKIFSKQSTIKKIGKIINLQGINFSTKDNETKD